MRLWTLHPRYLDRQGLLALWREGLLAQAVLLGRTKGYLHHPQLTRFREQPSPVASVAAYLEEVHKDAARRGYRFDETRIQRSSRVRERIPKTDGQLMYEWHHLRSKIRRRSPEHFLSIQHVATPSPHPLFVIVPGKIRNWEKTSQTHDSGGMADPSPVQ